MDTNSFYSKNLFNKKTASTKEMTSFQLRGIINISISILLPLTDHFSRINVGHKNKFTPPKSPSYRWMFVKTYVKSQSNLSNNATIKVCMFVFCFCLSREVFKYWSFSIASEVSNLDILCMFCIYCPWALRVLLRATPTVQWDIRFYGHLRG